MEKKKPISKATRAARAKRPSVAADTVVGAGIAGDVWELQPVDTVKAFRAFCIYRELGADRSLREVARRLRLSASQIEKWSSANGWHERCLAYDAHVYKQEQARRAEEMQRIRKRETTLSQAFTSLVMRRLVGYDGGGDPAKAVAALDPNTLNARDLALLIREVRWLSPASVGRELDLRAAALTRATSITVREVTRMINDLTEIFMDYIPRESRQLVAEAMVAYSEGRYQPPRRPD